MTYRQAPGRVQRTAAERKEVAGATSVEPEGADRLLDARGEDNWPLVSNKTGPTRLGFAVMPKCFELGGRFSLDMTLTWTLGRLVAAAEVLINV